MKDFVCYFFMCVYCCFYIKSWCNCCCSQNEKYKNKTKKLKSDKNEGTRLKSEIPFFEWNGKDCGIQAVLPALMIILTNEQKILKFLEESESDFLKFIARMTQAWKIKNNKRKDFTRLFSEESYKVVRKYVINFDKALIKNVTKKIEFSQVVSIFCFGTYYEEIFSKDVELEDHFDEIKEDYNRNTDFNKITTLVGTQFSLDKCILLLNLEGCNRIKTDNKYRILIDEKAKYACCFNCEKELSNKLKNEKNKITIKKNSTLYYERLKEQYKKALKNVEWIELHGYYGGIQHAFCVFKDFELDSYKYVTYNTQVKIDDFVDYFANKLSSFNQIKFDELIEIGIKAGVQFKNTKSEYKNYWSILKKIR